MSSSLWVAGGFVSSVTSGATLQSTLGTTWGHLVGTGTLIDDACEVKVYEPGVLSHLSVHVIFNSNVAANVTATLMKNGVATALSITIPAGVTGRFANTSQSVAFAAGDTFYIRYRHHGIFEGSIQVTTASAIFTPTDTSRCVTQLGTEQYAGFIGVTHGATKYVALHGQHTDGNASQTERQDCVPIDGTFRNARIYIADNPFNGPLVVTLQKNGVDTALAITVPAGQEGFFEETGVDVVFAAHDVAGWKLDATGASAGTLTFANIFVQCHSANDEWFLGLGQQERTAGADGINLTVGGLNYGLLTQAEQQLAATMAGRMKGLCLNVRVNNAAVQSTLRFRINGVDGPTTVVIPAGETGFFDAGGDETWAEDDLLSLRLETVGNQFSFSTIDWIGTFEFGAEPPPAEVECVVEIPSAGCWSGGTPSAQAVGAQPTVPPSAGATLATRDADDVRVGMLYGSQS